MSDTYTPVFEIDTGNTNIDIEYCEGVVSIDSYTDGDWTFIKMPYEQFMAIAEDVREAHNWEKNKNV